jgi:hypothetical protein
LKVITIVYRDPNGNLKVEKYDAADFSVRTDPGWMKLVGKEGIIRLLPSERVNLIEFSEEEEPARILSPHSIPPAS